MKKNLYEIFDEIAQAPDDESRAAILYYNNSNALRVVLRATFHPGIQFLVDEIPPYKKNDSPAGLSGNTLEREIHRIYLFEKYSVRRPVGLSRERMNQILVQILESLEAREAEVFVNMLKKDLKVPGLTLELVLRVYPDLLA